MNLLPLYMAQSNGNNYCYDLIMATKRQHKEIQCAFLN